MRTGATRRFRRRPARAATHEDRGRAERERLVEAFLPAVRAMARQYRHHARVDESDLVQAGVVGLLRAVERFDPSLGTPLWGYAAWWVRSGMQQVVAELAWPCVLSDRALRELARARSAEREETQRSGRGARLDDVARLVDLPRRHLQALTSATSRARCLDEPVRADTETTLAEHIEDPYADDPMERAALSEAAGRIPGLLAETLEPRERTVLEARFPAHGRAQTLGEIGDQLGVSAERVRQIEQGALATLRAAIC